MRLVRELLAADAEPAVGQANAHGRAARYLEVVIKGLGLRAGALLLADPRDGQLVCAASTLPSRARALLEEHGGRDGALARRSADERRAFLVRRSSDDPLVSVLHEFDAAVETVAILPLADRSTVGVLVLAGDEASLASETVRTLTPAVRLLAVLASARRDGGPTDPGAGRAAAAARAESERHAAELARARARVAALEAELAHRPVAPPASVPAPAVQPSAPDPVPDATAAPDDGPRTIVVIDGATEWERYPIENHRVVVVAPEADAGARIVAAAPDRVVVNLAAPGALDAAVALRASGARMPMIGVVADASPERIVALGPIEVVGRPPSADALIAAVERAAPRAARVFAAGRDADVFMRMRQVLAKAGLSVSLARDAKQIVEVVAMVRPQVLVVDLGLPMREGYELVMRSAAADPVPVMVVIAPDGDPTPVFREKLRDRLAAGQGMSAKQWLTDVVARASASTSKVPKTSATAAPAR